MARIRTIKPEFWSDEKMSPQSDEVRLLFLGLISMADDFGRLVDSGKQIEAFVWPYEDRSGVVRDGLVNLSRMGRIRRGKSASGQPVIEISNWSKHQRVDKPNRKAALPEVVEVVDDTAFQEPFANDSRIIRDSFRTDLDQRPTTNDQRPGSEGPARARGARNRAPAPEWLEPALAIWTQRVGHITETKLRRALGPLVTKHGWAAVHAALEVYVSPDEGPAAKGRDRRADWFAADFQRWHSVALEPLQDANGDLTPRARRLGGAA